MSVLFVGLVAGEVSTEHRRTLEYYAVYIRLL